MPNGNIGTLQRAIGLGTETFETFCAMQGELGMKPQELRRLYNKMKRDKLYRSEFYQVAIDKEPVHGFAGTTLWHLSIKRLDKEPIMDWRDMQAIKSQLCGDEAEAVQLFPAESRVVDTSNQYHLWVFMRMGDRRLPRLPFGWSTRIVTDEVSGTKARQRPRETV